MMSFNMDVQASINFLANRAEDFLLRHVCAAACCDVIDSHLLDVFTDLTQKLGKESESLNLIISDKTSPVMGTCGASLALRPLVVNAYLTCWQPTLAAVTTSTSTKTT